MKKILIILILNSLLASCSTEQKINLVFDNSSGITRESPILVNGYIIGEIEELELLNDHKTLTTIKLTESIKIPFDSKFKVIKNSILGNVSIEVELGKSKTMISRNDTILGNYSNQLTEIEKELLKVVKNINEIADSINK